MQSEKKTKISLELEEELIFKCDIVDMKLFPSYIDEERKKATIKIKPSPAKLLALSVLSCLAASFKFCLQKKNLILSGLHATAEITIIRNEKGAWRVKKIDTILIPKINNPELRKRADQCKKFFEQFCIILQSLREGIDIDVNLEY